jgi:hypothetical protein
MPTAGSSTMEARPSAFACRGYFTVWWALSIATAYMFPSVSAMAVRKEPVPGFFGWVRRTYFRLDVWVCTCVGFQVWPPSKGTCTVSD